MDVGARNRLLECSDCHSLYHQECHRPVVTPLEADDVWICQGCKDERRRVMERSPTPPLIPQAIPTVSKPVSGGKNSGGSSSSHRSSTSSSSSSSSSGKSSSKSSSEYYFLE